MGVVNLAGLSGPTLLQAEHNVAAFTCGHETLTSWLVDRARGNHASGASKTYVVADDSRDVVGYYCLSAGAIELASAPGPIRRNQPNPIPVLLLGRLAVHTDWEGHGIGSGLLKDAVLRASQAAQIVGARALMCHAIDEKAKAFYLRRGFVPSPSEPLMVLLGLATAKA